MSLTALHHASICLLGQSVLVRLVAFPCYKVARLHGHGVGRLPGVNINSHCFLAVAAHS